MALTHLLLAFSLLSVFLTFGATAYGTESYGNEQTQSTEKSKADPGSTGYQPKPNGEEPKSSGYEPKSSITSLTTLSYADKPKASTEKPKVDAGSDGYQPKPKVDEPKSIGSNGYQPKPTIEQPKSSGYEPKSSIKSATTAYGPESYSDKQKATMEKPKVDAGSNGYIPKPNVEEPKSSGYEPKSSIKSENAYGNESSGDKPKATIEKPKVDPGTNGYTPNPKVEKPKSTGYEPESTISIPKVEELYKKIGVQGIVYCQKGSKLIPVEGAVARVTCLTTDMNGYQTAPCSVLSGATDKKGYFFATLELNKLTEKNFKVSDCKVFLERSPQVTCNVPTDVNNGISGSLLSGAYHLLTDNKMKLYSVRPLIYGSEPTSDSGGY